MTAELVELMLDLRGYTRRLDDRSAFLSFWGNLSSVFIGRPLEDGKSYTLEDGSGTVKFTVIRNANPTAVVTPETRFAVHSLLEPPALRYTCDKCRESNQFVYGPFVCQQCRDAGKDGRVCDQHVVILDGSMRSTCIEHAPRCECAQAATFWCQGRDCRRNRGWCDAHRKRQKNDPDHSYCPNCYQALFPSCTHPGCANVGSLACESVHKTTFSSCGRRACPNHMQRWQVYGPELEGMALCSEHKGIRALSDDDLISQIVLATSARRVRTKRSPMLPSLQSVRHILRRARNKTYDLDSISRLFESFSLDPRLAPDLSREAKRLLDAHAERRRADRDRDQADKQAGSAVFERLRQELLNKGQHEIAALIRFSDFRPKSKQLYVVVPQDFLGRFFGSGGRNIKELSARIGVDVRLEKTGQNR